MRAKSCGNSPRSKGAVIPSKVVPGCACPFHHVMSSLQKLTIAALAVTLSHIAFGIEAGENPECPDGAAVEVRLKLAAVVE